MHSFRSTSPPTPLPRSLRRSTSPALPATIHLTPDPSPALPAVTGEGSVLLPNQQPGTCNQNPFTFFLPNSYLAYPKPNPLNRSRCFLAFLCLFCRMALLDEAKAQTVPVVRYTTSDGVVKRQVMSLMEDSRGYLWIGTKGSRYLILWAQKRHVTCPAIIPILPPPFRDE